MDTNQINKLNKLSTINIYYFQYYSFVQSVLTSVIIFLILLLLVIFIYKKNIIPTIFIYVAIIGLLLYISITLFIKLYTYSYSDPNNFDQIMWRFNKK